MIVQKKGTGQKGDPYSADIPEALQDYVKSAKYRHDTDDYEVTFTDEYLEKYIISRKQFFIGISIYQHNEQTLETLINQVVDSLPEPNKTIVQKTLEHSVVFKRYDEQLVQLASAIGMSEQEVDDFFQYCKNENWIN